MAMPERKKMRFLSAIVVYCIAFTSAIIVACYVAAWFGVDTTEVLYTTRVVFGGELLLAALLELMGNGRGDGVIAAGKAMLANVLPEKKNKDGNG